MGAPAGASGSWTSSQDCLCAWSILPQGLPRITLLSGLDKVNGSGLSAALAASLSAKVYSLAAAWGLGLELMGAAHLSEPEAGGTPGNPADCPGQRGFSASAIQTHGRGSQKMA